MDRVLAALERDPDIDIEASFAGALDADAGFRKLLREFSERASDAALFMATPGGPGLSMAVDALLLEGAERLHEQHLAAVQRRVFLRRPHASDDAPEGHRPPPASASSNVGRCCSSSNVTSTPASTPDWAGGNSYT